jgi:DNA (cytosine-5)-methyltransferase 1
LALLKNVLPGHPLQILKSTSVKPETNFVGMPRLTVRMVARLQGFPDTWQFSGAKTAAYRQVGNAFPPPVAAAVASGIAASLGHVAKGKFVAA